MSELKRLRMERGLYPWKVAEVLNLSKRSYEAYELGTRELPPRHYAPLAKLYGVPMETIYKAAKNNANVNRE